LLETRVAELLSFLFSCDELVEWVDLSLAKTEAFAGAGGVGLRVAISRSEYFSKFDKNHYTMNEVIGVNNDVKLLDPNDIMMKNN
jgi:hypothetical protein